MQINRRDYFTTSFLRAKLGISKHQAKRIIIINLGVEPISIDVAIRGRHKSVFLRAIHHYNTADCIAALAKKIENTHKWYHERGYQETMDILLDIQKNWIDPHDLELTPPAPRTIYMKEWEKAGCVKEGEFILLEKKKRQKAFVERFKEYNIDKIKKAKLVK